MPLLRLAIRGHCCAHVATSARCLNASIRYFGPPTSGSFPFQPASSLPRAIFTRSISDIDINNRHTMSYSLQERLFPGEVSALSVFSSLMISLTHMNMFYGGIYSDINIINRILISIWRSVHSSYTVQTSLLPSLTRSRALPPAEYTSQPSIRPTSGPYDVRQIRENPGPLAFKRRARRYLRDFSLSYPCNHVLAPSPGT